MNTSTLHTGGSHTEKYAICGGRIIVTLFGAPEDWRLRESRTISAVSCAAMAQGVRAIVSPDPRQFNARVCDPDDLADDITRGNAIFPISILRGVEADGTEINRGWAYYGATADCPTVIMYSRHGKRVLCAHAGLRSLVDTHHILDGSRSRSHGSVIDAMFETFPARQRHSISAHIMCGIGANNYMHRFEHPEYGERNRAIVSYILRMWGDSCVVGPLIHGRISLTLLIRNQLARRGVREDFITFDDIDTFGDVDRHKKCRWNSHRRDVMKNCDGGHNNGVLVARLW